MSVTIHRIEAIPFTLPLTRSFSYGVGVQRTCQRHVLVRVFDSDGGMGQSEITPRPAIHGETQAGATHAVRTHIAPSLVGCDIVDLENIRIRMDHLACNPTAKAGIDTALHDLLAKRAGVSLSGLLGGGPRPVPVSYMIGHVDGSAMLDEVDTVRAETGINAFKVKGGKAIRSDLARISALRRHLGDEAFLFVDANELYSEHDAHSSWVQEMARLGVAMIEEPVLRSAIAARSGFAQRCPVPVVGDDSVSDPASAVAELTRGSVHILGIKPPRSGLRRSVELISIARAFGVPCWLGSQGVTGIGTLSSAHFAAAFSSSLPYPADLGNFLRQGDDLLAQPVPLKDGMIMVPPGTGSGVEIDEDKLAHYGTED
ncbi:mandelate racemase/muconate lactonizing enzyme family protein [Paracoccus saliphilus]|uniref:L-alanine-DL-glutamate epimerase n=1 Tax=Paracoccus saliphilus TaxID=405559 RepID=A0AA45W7V4_9RHOB|nr:enolase C-terminal domain-like protein [Paracoccus saliphilus]WCR01551.1 hypothetical protein JHX88_11415 [Paracoccus saliphilus]SIT12490.1 L-alanine-DL-glutamate epimerase [Paracoccus saliphilus]